MRKRTSEKKPEKKIIMYMEANIRITINSLQKQFKTENNGMMPLKSTKWKRYQSRILYPVEIPIKNESKKEILKQTKAEKKISLAGFPGGAVVKNPPANAADTGSCPGPGRSHMPRSN